MLFRSIAVSAAVVAAAAALRPPATAPRSHIVRMAGGRFVPAELVIQSGDTVHFVNGSGGPHNVAFSDLVGAPAAALRRVMTDTVAPLAGPLLVLAEERYTIVFNKVPAGRYPYVCIPHQATMKGVLTIR